MCNKCNTTSCSCSLPSQIDSRSIIYKINSVECSSFLDELGITNGTDLEYIIDVFGKTLKEFTYFDVKGNIYGVQTFEEFMLRLQQDLKSYKDTLRLLEDSLLEKQEVIEELKLRLDALEKPSVTDTKGLGFTVDSPLQEILQKLVDHE